ncbi:MAG: cytochrome c oxidase subunit II [Elainellaceae cyanobacterium]
MKQIPAPLLTLTAGIVITLISLWVGQNHGLMPEQASVQAPLVDELFDVMVTIGTALFIVVEGAILYFVIRFRRRAGDDEDGIPLEGNLPLEAFWTAIPAIIVIGLGLYSVEVFQDMGGFSPGGQQGPPIAAHEATLIAQAPSNREIAGDVMPLLAAGDMEAMESPQRTPQVYGFGASPEAGDRTADLVVDVSGMQYAWLFNYPDSGILTGELHIPVDRDVQLNITARDVIHSFWVPQFRLKQDAIPGEQTELRFVASRPGTYPIVCAELCGSYHGGMRAEVIVHSEEEFEQWLGDNRVAQVSPEDGESSLSRAIATNTANLSVPEFLEPYGQEMGVDSASLEHLHHLMPSD